MNKMKIVVPPIKCQGIKTKLVEWILSNSIIPERGRWIEPFMGSGVVGFNAKPSRAIFSDINPHIVNFYRALKENKITPLTVKEFLEKEGEKLKKLGDKYYYEVRKRFNKYHNPLDFLFLSRAGFNGVIRFNSKGEFNVPFCKKKERFRKAYITKIVNQVSQIYSLLKKYSWEFRTGSFEELIMSASSRDFIYCDPPYFGRHTDYYNSWREEDELKLAEVLSQTKAKFILSTWYRNKYRENPSITKYWNNYYIITKKHFYHVGAKEINRNSIIEAIVLNYIPPQKQKNPNFSPYQIELF